jgi:hypothetical protein
MPLSNMLFKQNTQNTQGTIPSIHTNTKVKTLNRILAVIITIESAVAVPKCSGSSKVQWQSAVAKCSSKVQFQSAVPKCSSKVQWQREKAC